MRIRVITLALTVAAGTSPHFAGAESRRAPFAAPPVRRGPATFALGPARALAGERLGGTACRAIFRKLPDFTGRPAAMRLAEGGRSPSSHFARLHFVESAESPCGYGRVAAWSVAGDVHVRICSRTFDSVYARDRGEAAAILIHEALHTLGVAETAAQEPLTAFVRRHCGL